MLAAMVGHIFGYEAALSIDAQARPLREARALLEGARRRTMARCPRRAGASARDGGGAGFGRLRSGAYDGHLNASTAARLTSLLRYATGALPVEGYEAEMGKVGTPSAIAADLIEALGTAIDELTRPVDAIKHQAKTVTVGISRSEGALLRAKLVAETLSAGATVERSATGPCARLLPSGRPSKRSSATRAIVVETPAVPVLAGAEAWASLGGRDDKHGGQGRDRHLHTVAHLYR